MQDWAGNIAEDGDVLHFVSIKPAPKVEDFVRDPETGRLKPIQVQRGRGSGFTWNRYFQTKVFDHDGVLYCESPTPPGIAKSTVPVNYMYDYYKDNGGWEMGSYICIERNSSDPRKSFNTFNEEVFFRNYFWKGIISMN